MFSNGSNNKEQLICGTVLALALRVFAVCEAANVMYPVDYNESMNTVLNQASRLPVPGWLWMTISCCNNYLFLGGYYTSDIDFLSPEDQIGNFFALATRNYFASTSSLSRLEALLQMCAKR